MRQRKYFFSDIGGVLLSNGWGHESRMEAARVFGFDYDEMNHRHNFIFNVYEIGKISLDDYLNVAVFYQPRSFTKTDFKEFMLAQSRELPDMLPYLIEWKKRHPNVTVISINNEPRDLNQYRIEKFRLHRFFDAFVSSCEVGMRKPDPGIFQVAIGLVQTDPSQCLYIDDRQMLAESAATTGLNAHWHRNFDETRKLLDDWVAASP